MNSPRTPALSRPYRLLAATAALALAGGLLQTAQAQSADAAGIEMASPMAGPGGPGGHEGHRMGGPGMGGMDMLGGRGLQRMLDAVAATPEQRAQVKQIVDAARTDLRAQHKSAAPQQDAAMALFTQPTVDARAVEALRQQRMAQHDAASKRMTQAMLELSRVLTPEQRKTLAERMAQRRAMMQRHRSERQSLDGQPAAR